MTLWDGVKIGCGMFIAYILAIVFLGCTVGLFL